MKRLSHQIIHLVSLLSLTLSNALECTDWNNKVISLPDDRIDDGYCDCPGSGSDEPNTEACSGLDAWPAVKAQEAPRFACPQQPDLLLSPSKLNDGICDCCDGADETKGTECTDICEDLLAAQRAEAAARIEGFNKGALKRSTVLAAHAHLVEETKGKLDAAKVDLEKLETEIESIRSSLDKELQVQLEERTRALIDRFESVDLLNGLTTDELDWFITHACQLSGEMGGHGRKEGKTCTSLRLAGLDISLLWEQSTYKAHLTADKIFLARALDHNMNQSDENNYVWTPQALDQATKKQQRNRRRLEEMYDEDYYDDYDEYDGEEEDYHEEEELEDDPPSKSDADVKRDEMHSLLSAQPFSHPRMNLIRESDKILAQLDDLKARFKEQRKRSDEEKEEAGELEVKDPKTFTLAKNELQQRKKSVERGMDYAISAKVLLDQMKDAMGESPYILETLRSLALGTLVHGGLSVVHVWHVLAHIVPELKKEVDADEQTCSPPWSCPVGQVERETGAVPPQSCFKALEKACADILYSINESACTVPSDESIPQDVVDGFAGYYVAHSRNDDDYISKILGDMELERADETKRKAVLAIESRLSNTEDSKAAKKSEIEDMQRLVDGGGEGSSSYGPDSELYALRDTCHEIEAGKYVYELCLFGSSRQKEGQSKGGTDLGKWTGASFDDDGQRIWKWENGAKCWNGPKRSATVHVTCGMEEKLLSAEEPDTCRYVFEMESYVACDDAYKARYNL